MQRTNLTRWPKIFVLPNSIHRDFSLNRKKLTIFFWFCEAFWLIPQIVPTNTLLNGQIFKAIDNVSSKNVEIICLNMIFLDFMNNRGSL